MHVFADTPHMLKLVRNNILDHTIESPFGNVSSELLYEIVHYQKGGFKLTPKVSKANLYVKGPQRQKVKVTAQLLSKTMAKSLEYLENKDILKSKDLNATYQLIALVNKWFDIMNSSTKNGDKPSRSSFTSSAEQLRNLASCY